MKHWKLAPRMSAAVAVVAVLFAAVFVVLILAIGQLRDSSQDARKAETTVALATRVGQLVVDAETGVRGYAITSRESFLEPLASAQQALPLAAADLADARFEDDRENTLADRIAERSTAYVTEYAAPLVETLRSDRARGLSVMITAAGKRRVDAIRADITALSTLAQRTADRSAAAADDHATAALREAVIGGILGLLVLVGLVVYLARTIARPVREIASAAERLGSGDLAARVVDRGHGDEVGTLARTFNTMGTSLEDAQAELEAQSSELEQQNTELESQAVELESQTVELEAQAAELEHGQQELTEANASLVAQKDELHATAEALRLARDRVELFAAVTDQLSRRESLTDRADALLESTAEMVGALVGLVYSVGPGDGYADRDSVPALVAARGVLDDQVPSTLVAGEGLAGRAVAERRIVVAAHGAGDLRLESFGSTIDLRHELHAPLLYGDRVVGVLSLARTGEAPYSPEELQAIEHLAEQAAVAFDNAVVSERRRRLADVNRAVLNATQDAIQMLAPDETTLLANPAMDRFRREVLGIPGADEVHDIEEVRRNLAARMKDPVAYQARVQQMLSDKEYEGSDEFELDDRSIARYTAPVYTDDHEFLGRIFVLRDTTDQRELERAKDELMATVSHELRTPLAAILGFAELLMARDYEPEERNEHLQTIHQQATRLSELISDFLDLQRLEHDGEGVRRNRLELTDVLRSQIELFSAQSGRHKLKLRTQGELVVQGDEERLRRVMANLLSNAIKYSPQGGEVTVAASRRDGDVVIAVEDHGIGIPPEMRERVFERFYRVDSSETRKIGGTGLGLALVREIMRAHGGEVGVDSVEGQGSRFWIRIPAVA